MKKVAYHFDGLPPLPIKSQAAINEYIEQRKSRGTIATNNGTVESAKELMKYRATIMLHNLEAFKLNEKFSGKEEIKIASIGCGLSHDLIALIGFLGELKIPFEYYGFDIKEGYIEVNKGGFASFDNVKYAAGDICANYQQQPEKQFDFVILQQPNLQGNEKANYFIKKLFSEVIPHLIKKDGYLYTSFLLPEEHNTFLNIIRNELLTEKSIEEITNLLSEQQLNNEVVNYYDIMPNAVGIMERRKPESIAIITKAEFFNFIPIKEPSHFSTCKRLML